uniref:3-hydroxy-3-methylglutaryl coenzyme A reductase n=1 Tax=Rhodosorus marinus TaxID=101924 RepID=A0A7S2ZQM4_9RHOD|mmetsp:Transcript_28361/g.111322  ORF Transcript_28361/g.111322 Transcript_28361/m.111322 type:complete len:582 (+) Transcript_28361:425-2170(+)|eukprot:CAMPEP_0113968178 /NCGR_PEP_ID=MMETSP0011_2-20120614/9369_1 /TAXON_ID=101924 /ORGANISM="Rhodosorus marinus" /LENGTH=581 /DNA_ID=CAMNT_0000981199 /DNA_START=177 /DNA_END=1922 /DNA_ORIENTATION=- /assembly_acc=CAM_ASM_000156
MSAEAFLEQLGVPGIGLKLVGLFFVSVFILFWPGIAELSDSVITYIAESKTGQLTRRVYRTIAVPHRGEEPGILQEVAINQEELNSGVLRLQTWIPARVEKGVQCENDSAKFNSSLPPRPPSLDAVGRNDGAPSLLNRSIFSSQLKAVSSSSSIVSLGSGSSNSLKLLEDEQVLAKLRSGEMSMHALEKTLGDTARAVRIRREYFSQQNMMNFEGVPFEGYDYDAVFGSCCEVVVGYLPIPLGVVGPLHIDGEVLHVPMATTEGTLVASTNRGCKAISLSGGVETTLVADGITRAPCVQLPSVREAAIVKRWLDDPMNIARISESFNSTTRYGRLESVKTVIAGRLLYIRFKCFSGDAMGMNMVSKGTDCVLEMLLKEFPNIEVVSLSGNFCTDKKPAAVNWIEGRGKSVSAEAIVKGDLVKKVLKTSVASLVDINYKKNMVGSAMAGSIGGYNAHAANIVSAVFLATGQDPAQVVESANCITLLEECNGGADLRIMVTMPSIEVGTIGGGTILGPQGANLEMLGCRRTSSVPGENSAKLAKVIAGTVMCAELSLLSALSVGHLVQAHMKHNRSSANLAKS